jgi:hypothetical protein
VGDPGISDEELTALALAADPDAPLDDGAVSLWDVAEGDDPQLLPGWYMPPPMVGTRRLTGGRRRAALVVVISFVGINACGLCSTYGWVGFG